MLMCISSMMKKQKNISKQYGDPYRIFEGDTTLANREKISEFINLPPDYYGDGE